MTRWRMLAAWGIVLSTAAPVLKAATDDSYPFSTYPMFARPLSKHWLTYAEGLASSGSAIRLPPEIVANGEPMQAMQTLRLTGEHGGRPLRRLCADIAGRVAGLPAYREVERVRIARARFNPLRYFEDDASPEDQEQLTLCKVRRPK